MNWLEFGRAASAILITLGIVWPIVSPKSPRLAAQMVIILSVFVSILLGVSTVLERLGGGQGAASDLSTLVEYLDEEDPNDSSSDGED